MLVPGLSRLVPVGSRVTCNPPPTDTDEDWLALETGPWDRTGWEKSRKETSSTGSDDIVRFTSYRQGNLNLIVAHELEFYERFLAASSVAKRLNLLSKPDRIALFQAVLYGKACDS